MAADRRYRQQNRVTSDREKFYVYGNAVRQAEVQPKRRQEVRPAKTGKTSSQVMRNRNRAMRVRLISPTARGACGLDRGK